MFRTDNTSGYSQQECDELNSEFAQRYAAGDWGQIEREQAEKSFADEVSRR